MPKKAARKKPASAFRPAPRSSDLPASRAMLDLVRSELKSDIRELRSEMKAGLNRVDARFEHLAAEISQIHSETSQIKLLVEEQNANNRVVLEGLTGLWQRQERIEGRMSGVEEFVRTLPRSRG